MINLNFKQYYDLVLESLLKERSYVTSLNKIIQSSNLNIIPFNLNTRTREDKQTDAILRLNNIGPGDKIPVISYDGRRVVVINLGKIKLPFYISTGEGGKDRDLVPTGYWYPFFGIGPGDGWINKGSTFQISRFYNSRILADTCKELNKVLPESLLNTIMIPALKKSIYWKDVLNNINADLTPVDSRASYIEFARNISQAFSKLGEGTVSIKLTGSSGETHLNIPADMGRGNLVRIIGEDAKFYSNPQFHLGKSEKYFNMAWFISPSETATNNTKVNGKIITDKLVLRRGDIISLGKDADKGKITVQL